jgi:hypothetical protein
MDRNETFDRSGGLDDDEGSSSVARTGLNVDFNSTSPGKSEADSISPRLSKYLPMFLDWCDNLLIKLRGSLPCIKLDDVFIVSCEAVLDADNRRIDAVKKRDEISKHNPVDQDALNKANQEIANTESKLQARIAEATLVADTVLYRADIQAVLSDLYDDRDLITYTILTEASPLKLAQWCDEDPNQANQLLGFLHDTYLMRIFLQSGGARNGEYPRAVQIFNQINPDQSNPVLHRLALAVALELASGYSLFDNPSKTVDPIQRYVHYEQAYLLGELDPNFSRFNVWEMRQIVNSDATEDELGWGRQSLMNYRPDIVYSEDPQWRYCWIVRSDVSYNDPDWYVKEVYGH